MTGIILSGGKSLRMGCRKEFIKIEGITIIERIIYVLSQIAKEIIIVTNDSLSYTKFETRIVTDIIPFKGPLGGIFSGLFYAKSFPAFVVACDMPFISKEVISFMLNQWDDSLDLVVPCDDKGYHPLFALYGEKAEKVFRNQILKNKLAVQSALKYLKKKVIPITTLNQIDPSGKSFFNLNTPEDLKKAHQYINTE